ncbi:MAG: polysaccharide biosynthesis/export family protein [Halanaerobiales bacterium]|nr:polysaccharide biosynthesis/export family protein [Halanaerobiales bacterium]
MSKILRSLIIVITIVLLVQFSVIAEEGRYLLSTGDMIEFSVWNHPDLTKRMIVRPDGFISVPLAGELKAENLTPNELQTEIETLLAKYINSPQVTISVIEFKIAEVSVLGAVVRSGVYQIDAHTRLLEVLARAAIDEKVALLEEVSLTRNDSVIKIDVERLLREGGYQNYDLQEGDVIYVPFATREVYILGEVKKPGAYAIEKKTTPADVLAMAGGPTERGDLKKVKIIHKADFNSIEVINLKDYLDNNTGEQVIYLQDGDIIQIEETKSINWEKIFTYAAGIKIIHDLIVNW